jgi:hypothetical protein
LQELGLQKQELLNKSLAINIYKLKLLSKNWQKIV